MLWNGPGMKVPVPAVYAEFCTRRPAHKVHVSRVPGQFYPVVHES
jgi:hypothetical protein